MYTIRPFEPTDAEYDAVVAVANAAWPDEQDTVANWKHNDANRNADRLFQRFTVENDTQEIVAEAACWESNWSHVPGKYVFEITIHPDCAQQGIEALCYDHLLNFLSLREPKPTTLQTFTREDKTNRIQFLTDHGYKMAMREANSQIDLADYDFSHFEKSQEKVLGQGIELLTLPEIQARDQDWMKPYHALFTAIITDIPDTDDTTPQPIAEFAKEFEHPNFLPNAQFFALEDGKWVGLSTIWKDAVQEDRHWVGVTGILPSHRRRGIATALKWLTFDYARRHNVRYIVTENEENNPMYDLNIALGFEPLPGWLTYRKEI
ncbi:MAG: GNAT family N-acetyltransferase [Chloroflexota bacterium]